MATFDFYKEKARNGARFLSRIKEFSEWYLDVDIATLNMSNSKKDILYQVTGKEDDDALAILQIKPSSWFVQEYGLSRIMTESLDLEWDNYLDATHLKCIAFKVEECRKLTQAWIEIIEKLRSKQVRFS